MVIELRPWVEEDAFALQALSMHPYFSKQRILKYFYPDSFFNAMSTIYFYQNADPKRFVFRAVLADQKVVGFLSAQVKTESACELSYWVGHEYWNQGIMTNAISLMCKEVCNILPVLCIYAIVDQKNIASQKVLEANQFQKEQVEHFFIYRYYK